MDFTTQYSAILNKFTFTKRISNRSLILCSLFLKIALGIVMFYISNVVFNEKHVENILYINVGFLIISCFIKSISSYKETALLKSDIYLYSLFSMEKIYNLNISSSLLWLLFENISSLSLLLLLNIYLKKFVYTILSLTNCILLLIFIFTLFNKIQVPVGAIRFLFYAVFYRIAFFSSIYSIGYTLLSHHFFILNIVYIYRGFV